MTRHTLLLLPALLVLLAVRSPAADTKDIEELLKREIVGSTLPMTEVQRYCEARVPAMPKVESAAAWQAEAQRLRQSVLDKIVYRGRAAAWRDAPVKVEWLQTIEGGPGYRIKKLRFEAVPGMWIPALLYEPEKLAGKVPAVLNVNGHVGSPGNAYVPKQLRAINQAKKQPSTSAIACRVIARVNVLVIALTMPGVVKALTQPSMPQTIGWPGRAI